jgi:polyphosphate glucokinase
MMEMMGVDVGGSGIKGALVDLETGELLAAKFRLATPKSAKPKPVAKTVAKVVRYFDWDGPVGIGFPAAIRGGIAVTAANIHKKWIGLNVKRLFTRKVGSPVVVVNDADAAGLAEMRFGAGRDRQGVVLIVTIGTGLGTSVFSNGILVPNSELGHIEIDCEDAELMASDAARKGEELSWKEWGERFNAYLTVIEKLIWPDLIILGGGVSKRSDRFMNYLTVKCEVVPAKLLNEAGIVGAALAAQKLA